MPFADDTVVHDPAVINAASSENLAEALLTSPIFGALFPGVAYVLAVLLQTELNDLVNMAYGSSILYLTFGVRLFVALVFGFKGLLWMILGQLFIFVFYPTPYYEQHPVEGFLLTCWYSVLALLSVELVRKIKRLEPNFIRVKNADILLITFFAALFSSVSHFRVLGDYFAAPIYNMFMSFAAKFVGSMIGFYTLMLFFSLLYGFKFSKNK